jgi:FkbM family methyltransferase
MNPRAYLLRRLLGPQGQPGRVGRLGLTWFLRISAWRRGLRCRVLEDGSVSLTDRDGCREIRLKGGHSIYALGAIQSFDYFHDAVEPVLEGGVAVLDCREPRLHRLRPSGLSLRFTALPEPESTSETYLRHAGLGPGDLVIDFGAYCGGSTLAFARAVGPGGHVVAFEPDPANAAALRENVARHADGLVTVREAGVWSRSRELEFAAEGNMGAAIASVLPRPAATVRVPVLSLADAMSLACEVSGLSRVAFIKMDVEGAEAAVLEQAEVLRLHRPRLVIELHWMPGPSRRLTTEAVRAPLLALGYQCTTVRDAGGGSLLVAAPGPGSVRS